jgi:hypothetical protein
MKLPKFVQPHTATITEYEGDGAYGPIWGDSYEIDCYFVHKKKITFDEEGNEITSPSQLHTSADINPKEQSEVSFEWTTKPLEIIAVNRYDNALTGQLSNVEIMLR